MAEVGDSQQEDIKPTIEEDDDLYADPLDTAGVQKALDTGAKAAAAEATKDEGFKFAPQAPAAEAPAAAVPPPPQPISRDPPTRWASRVPTTSPKFDLLRYANKLLKSNHQLIQFVYKCEFRGKGGEFLVKEGGYNANFRKSYDVARNPHGRIQPVFGLLRLVFPSNKNPETHHIVPYLMTGTEATPTVWFLEQYDTTFWWLYKNPDWHKAVADSMFKGAVGVRAYVEAADKITNGNRIKYRDIPGITGNSVDLQKTSRNESAETCVPWSLVILKYLLNPQSIGLDSSLRITNLATANPADFNTMYEVLYRNRDDMLKWVQGLIYHYGGKRRTRRRRQTRRKTKRSRK
jgi:hypothetical protein